MGRPALFVAVTAALSAVIGLVAAGIARLQGVDINPWISGATALVVGAFLALLWLGPRQAAEPDADGFQVVATKESEPEAVAVRDEDDEHEGSD